MADFVGGREIVTTGTIVAASAEEKIVIKILDNITIEFSFLSAEGEKATVHRNIPDPHHVYLTLRNFDNAIGTAWSDVIGKARGQDMHVTGTVFLIGSVTKGYRVLHYTISLGI